MIEHLISLMIAFASFIACMVMGNSAIANPIENSTLTQTPSSNVIEVVNLNVSSPFLQLNNKTANSIFDHLGCSCNICTQGIITSASKI